MDEFVGKKHNKFILKFSDHGETKFLSIETILSLSEDLHISEQKQHILKNIISLNVGYLTLNRIMGTLSGGELTRLYLAEFMAVSENAAIINDESVLITKHY